MSMISALIDELRNTAEFYDGFKAANLMRDAADTIWQLRDDLQRTNAENAKLRMLIDLKQTCWKYVGLCDECPYNGVDDEHDDCNCTVREKVNSLARELGIEVEL